MKNKRSRFLSALLATVLLIVVIGGATGMAYRTGFSRGAITAQNYELPDGETPFRGQFSYGGHWGYPMMRHHFGFGGFLFSLLAFFLVFGMIRRLFFFSFWGHRRGWRKHGWSGRGPWSGGPWDDDDDDQDDPEAERADKTPDESDN